MEKPTDEQIKEFWGKIGFEFSHKDDGISKYKDPKGIYEYLPDIKLGTLFKYAVPKIEDPSISLYKPVLGGNYWVCVLGHKGCCDDLGNACGDTPALALFWAIYEVVKKGEVNEMPCL
uniref:Phage ABA sandwich domain-containing protein n=1 Tax=viral metagenome TaxID=1070528 RepID=A0A6H2A573_9ZZZZ